MTKSPSIIVRNSQGVVELCVYSASNVSSSCYKRLRISVDAYLETFTQGEDK